MSAAHSPQYAANDAPVVTTPPCASAPAEAEIEPRRFRDAVGAYPTGVAIVTVSGLDGRPIGLTVNSFASVSLDPPLVLWSLATKSANRSNFLRASGFAIHILGSDQLLLAKRFASPAAERFTGLDFEVGSTGAPLLRQYAARLECSTFSTIEAGDHDIFVGRVIGIDMRSERQDPLTFHRGRFAALDPRLVSPT